MNKLTLLSILLFLTACGPVAAQAAPGNTPTGPQDLATRTERPSPTATWTVTASPTIGYQATAYVAQQTADAAARLLVDATREHEAEQMEYARMTEQAGQWTHQAAVETATAYATVIPVSQTAAEIHNRVAFGQQTQAASALTATVEAPLIKRRSAEADAQAKLAWVIALAKAILWAGTGVALTVLMINMGLKIQHEREGIAYWMKYGPTTAASDGVPLEPKGGRFEFEEKRNAGGNYPGALRGRIPDAIATAEEHRAVAEILRSGHSFSRANVSGGDKPLSHPRYARLCDWLVREEMAEWIDPGNHQRGVTLLDRGKGLFGIG